MLLVGRRGRGTNATTGAAPIPTTVSPPPHTQELLQRGGNEGPQRDGKESHKRCGTTRGRSHLRGSPDSVRLWQRGGGTTRQTKGHTKGERPRSWGSPHACKAPVVHVGGIEVGRLCRKEVQERGECSWRGRGGLEIGVKRRSLGVAVLAAARASGGGDGGILGAGSH